MGEGGEGLIDRLLGGQRAVPLAIYCNLTSMGEKKNQQSLNLHIFHLHMSPGVFFFNSYLFFIKTT